ncbi:MAG: hypothetical protein ACAH95_08705 [Fimbriimonas sp.]
MVQDVVIAAYRWLVTICGYLWQLLPLLLVAGVATGLLVLAWRRWDPEGSAKFGTDLKRISGRAAWIGVLALVTASFAGALVQSAKVVQVRRDTVREAEASRTNDPNLSGVVQFAPSVGIIEEKTYSRVMTLPPDFLNRVSVEGVQILAPYLSDPSAEGVTKLADSFRRNGTDVIFERQVTRKDEIPVPADVANVKTDFKSVGGDSGRRHFEATFSAEYRFKNPRSEAAEMRFNFPLPQGGGILQGFTLTQGSNVIREADEHGLYVWTGNVPAGGSVTVNAKYTVTGAGGYNYVLGSERRRIGDFTFVAQSDNTLKFGRSGIFPSRLGSSDAEWKLKDVLTFQSIALVFPRADVDSEILDKTLSIFPALLVFFALGAAWLFPNRALLATIAVALAYLAIPMLSSYVPPNLATIIGALGAIAAGGFVLQDRRGWALSGLAGLMSAAFLTNEHGMLIGWVVAAAAVVVFIRWRREQASTEEKRVPIT